MMTAIEAATLYAGLFLLLFLALKVNVGRVRVGEKVNLGDGGNDKVVRAIRAQGNAVEDVPITLIGLYGVAFSGGAIWFVHLIGSLFILGRVLHAVGISQMKGLEFGRTVGTLISVLSLLATAIACIWLAVS